MDMNAAYREVGSYRAAAQLCGTTAKTVRRAVLAADVDGDRHRHDVTAQLRRRRATSWLNGLRRPTA